MFRKPSPTRLSGSHGDSAPEAALQPCDSGATAEFRGLRLSSAYQPVFSITHRRAVGHEALLRAHTAEGDPVSPLDVFARARTEAEVTHLDRLCRTLHLRNHRDMKASDTWLFLNINPEVVVHGKNYGAFFAELLRRHEYPAHRLVVEILEDAIRDEPLLAEAVDYYRNLGCLVAIDDFGSGHSNFARLWRLAPDIVKLDRSLITQATHNRQARRILPGLVSLIHEAGSLVVMEGVETEDEALISMDADVDLVQGYYFGRPGALPVTGPHSPDLLHGLYERFKGVAAMQAEAKHANTDVYLNTFKRCASAFQSGLPIERACAEILAERGVERCYLLDAEGAQIGTNLVAAPRVALADPRFAPLEDASGARWFRRPYFRRAVGQPGQIMTSRPYLSLTGAHMCVTLSVAIDVSAERRVLCCDIAWETADRSA
jgi:EAL domain-containing protein (putative c-di-GMP-specific phosphodiesterase class I)